MMGGANNYYSVQNSRKHCPSPFGKKWGRDTCVVSPRSLPELNEA